MLQKYHCRLSNLEYAYYKIKLMKHVTQVDSSEAVILKLEELRHQISIIKKQRIKKSEFTNPLSLMKTGLLPKASFTFDETLYKK